MATTKTYRLIVCVDIDAENLSDAYARLQACMKAGMAASDPGISWETSDEWFGEDEYGEPGDPAELQASIMENYHRAKAVDPALEQLKGLTEARDELLVEFEHAGHRGVEIADRIDVLNDQIRSLEESLKKPQS